LHYLSAENGHGSLQSTTANKRKLSFEHNETSTQTDEEHYQQPSNIPSKRSISYSTSYHNVCFTGAGQIDLSLSINSDQSETFYIISTCILFLANNCESGTVDNRLLTGDQNQSRNDEVYRYHLIDSKMNQSSVSMMMLSNLFTDSMCQRDAKCIEVF
jgi:hypothetical protein